MSHARGHPAAGFTLIEVLIAATLLFVVIAITAETYRGALLATRRAESVVGMLAPIPLITADIRNTLRNEPLEAREGRGILMGVDYEYEATTARFGSPPKRFDPTKQVLSGYPPRFRLYDVTLTLRFHGQTRVYVYQELAWLPV
jgi:hypothetical protein